MVEMFEGQCVDWDKFTAEDALVYTKEAQKDLQRQEYINIIKEIARVAKLGQSKLTFSKKLTDYTISKLESNGFKVSSIKQRAYVTTTCMPGSEAFEHWETTIEW